eukprot:gene1023-1298_t
MENSAPMVLSTHLTQLPAIAQQLITYAAGCKIWLFTGDLGAGKTTLIQAICHQLGVKSHVSSPTFSIVNTYPLGDGWVYHIDAYRLKNVEEVIEMDFPFYFETGYCFLEWPSKIPQALFPTPHISIELSHHEKDEHMRKLCVQWIY